MCVSCPIETSLGVSLRTFQIPGLHKITHFSYPRNVTPRFTANIRTRFIASRTNTNTARFAEINSHVQPCKLALTCMQKMLKLTNRRRQYQNVISIQQPLNEEPNLLRSSKYKANRNGESTEPCRTPKLISKAGYG